MHALKRIGPNLENTCHARLQPSLKIFSLTLHTRLGGHHAFFFVNTLFCASSEESVVGLLAAGSLPQGGWDGAVKAGLSAAEAQLASVPARIGEDLMQIGHGSFAQFVCGGGELEECGGVGALGRSVLALVSPSSVHRSALTQQDMRGKENLPYSSPHRLNRENMRCPNSS